MLLVERQEGHPACKKTEWWGASMVICLGQCVDMHIAQLMPLPLTVSCFSKIQIGFTFLYQHTQVVPEKGPLNGCIWNFKNAVSPVVCPPCDNKITYSSTAISIIQASRHAIAG